MSSPTDLSWWLWWRLGVVAVIIAVGSFLPPRPEGLEHLGVVLTAVATPLVAHIYHVVLSAIAGLLSRNAEGDG